MTVATSTELLRAAEHMRNRSKEIPKSTTAAGVEDWLCLQKAAIALEREAGRLQAVESKAECENRCKRYGQFPHDPGCCSHDNVTATAEADEVGRSWPDGWPPFAVLRRAYEAMEISPEPSTLRLERHGSESERRDAIGLRRWWVDMVDDACHGRMLRDDE